MSNTKYDLYVIANDGEGVPQALQGWDGESSLEIRLSAFAKDAVIVIEPTTSNQERE